MSLEPPLPPPPTPPQASPSRARLVAERCFTALRTGWGRAALAAILVLAVGYLLNLVLAWMQMEASDRLLSAAQAELPIPIDTPGILKTALLSLMIWHGVSANVSVPIPAGDPSNPFAGGAIEASANITLLLGFALSGYLLYRVGKAVAGRRLERDWTAGAAGLQIAIVYAGLMLLLGLLAGTDIEIPGAPGVPGAPAVPGVPVEQPASYGSVSVSPSLFGAFALPFLLALLAAGAGALSGRLAPRERSARMVLGAVSGGWRAAWMAVALASIGFLIVAALNPDVTRAYLQIVPGGGIGRTLLVISTLLIVPNAGTGIAAAAMGGSINISALGDSCAVISFMQFPQGFAQPTSDAACALPFDLGTAPVQYLLFLLVPLAATFAGGRLAAERAPSTSMRDGALAGLAIALPYALWLWLIALIARLGYAAGGFFPFELRFWIGPGLLSTFLVALAWGAVGGAIGGAFGARKASGPGTHPSPQAEASV